jgi:hypothetical protein
MKEKMGLNTPAGAKTRMNELSSRFVFLGNGIFEEGEL